MLAIEGKGKRNKKPRPRSADAKRARDMAVTAQWLLDDYLDSTSDTYHDTASLKRASRLLYHAGILLQRRPKVI